MSIYYWLNNQVLLPLIESGQYASDQITTFCDAHELTRSMGYTGVCWDNAMAESYFATLKNDGAFARLCGAAPIPISSGKTNRMRLHRGGDRQANRT